MRSTTRDTRIGIIALVGGTALVLLLLIGVARYPAMFMRGEEYRAVFTSVPGLNTGDDVRYGGLLVGTVADLRVAPGDPTHILVTFRVRSSTPIRANTHAVITQMGLLGDPYLNLEPGSADAPPLPPGSTVPSTELMSFQDAVTRLAQFFDRADTLLTGVERIAGTHPWDRIDATLARLEQLVGTTADASDRVLTNLDLASERLNAVLDRTDRLLATVDTSIRAAGPGLAETQREALATVREMHDLLIQLQLAMDAGGGVDELLRNVSQASANIADLTERLDRDPTSVLKQRKPPRKTAGPPVRN